MIILVHQNNILENVLDSNLKKLDVQKFTVVDAFFYLARTYPNELIIWCHSAYKEYLNIDAISSIFHHRCMMVTYSLQQTPYLSRDIGYIDSSIYVNVAKDVRYPTWLMHSDVGGIHGSVLNEMQDEFLQITDFDYLLNAIGKICMPQGLFCYSDPNLLLRSAPVLKEYSQISKKALFRFVKSYYKSIWVYVLALCLVVREKQLHLWDLLRCLGIWQKKIALDLSVISLQSNRQLVSNKTVDVIIPTIGRKTYLFDVLKDLSQQTHLPDRVIIVEQNPTKNSGSELDYLGTETWPFQIVHHFIHQTGACNARNKALAEVRSEWVILGDDDNRFDDRLIENFFKAIEKYGVKVISSVYLQPNEKQLFNITGQTSIFGSGNSIIKSDLLDKVSFDIAFEYGYGEDKDFGMQIRNVGEDVIFDASIIITHLRAPMGGFRIPFIQKWDNDLFQPKPSPTISLFNLKYFTKEQLFGYKIVLFIKYYKSQSIMNPYIYSKTFKKEWESSLKWAKYLMNG